MLESIALIGVKVNEMNREGNIHLINIRNWTEASGLTSFIHSPIYNATFYRYRQIHGPIRVDM